MTPEPPDHPFATALTVKILKLIQERDLALLELRGELDRKEIDKHGFVAALEVMEANAYEEILAACTNVLRTADGMAARVLEIQKELNNARALEAQRMPGM